MDLSNVQLDASPHIPDASELPPSLAQLLKSRNLCWSWQPFSNPTRQGYLSQLGLANLPASQVKEWDKDVARSVFDGEPGVRRLVVEGDLIRNGDSVLMVISEAQRERLMEQDRIRRARQSAKPKDELAILAEQLKKLGISSKTTDSGIGVDVQGFTTREEAEQAGGRRRDPVTGRYLPS